VNAFARRLASLSVLTISVATTFSACQSSTSTPAEPSTNERTSVVAKYTLYVTEPQKVADSATWAAGQYSGAKISPVVDSKGEDKVKYAAPLSLPAPLGAQPLTLSLWKCGLRIIRLSYTATGSTNELTLTPGSAEYDELALTLFDTLNGRGVPLTRANLIELYASWLLAGDPKASKFPDSLPVGLSRQEVVQAVLVAASKSGSTLASLAKTWSLDISTDSARTLTLQLIASSQISSSDSAKLFPPPTIRLDAPISVATGLVVGGNPVSVSGSFGWNAGLGQASLYAYARQGSTVVKSSVIAAIGLPTPAATATHASLDSASTTLFANSTATEGDYQLVVVARLANGDSAKATANFHVGPKEPAKAQAPTIRLLSPLDNASFPFDSTRVTTRWIATTAQGSIDSVVINGSLATGHDSTWTSAVALEPTGKPTAIVAKARNTDGLWTTVGISLVRAVDAAPPIINRLAGGRILTYDSLSASVSWQLTDNDQVALVHIQDLEAKGSNGIYAATPALHTGDNIIRIDATDRQGNVARDSVVLHVLAPVRISRLAPASDSQEAQTGAVLVSWVVRNAKSVSIGGVASISTDSVYSANLTLSGQTSAITLVATDSAGRKDSSRVVIVKRLQTPLKISYAPQADPDSVTVLAASDAGASFSWSLDGKTWTPCLASFSQKTSGTIRVKAHVEGKTDSVVTGTLYDLYHANHAPVIALSPTSLVAKSYLGGFKLSAASVTSWGAGDSTQTGTWQVQQYAATDSQFLSGLSMTTNGTLDGTIKLDTSIILKVRFRLKDNGGTARGGVDTSVWSDWQSIQIVDTVLDAQGNSYRARRMPDGKVWMRENLHTKAPFGDTAWARSPNVDPDSAKYLYHSGRNYTWAQAMALDSICDTSTCKPSGIQRGICPTGWHVSDLTEWQQLITSLGSSNTVDSIGLRRIRAGSNWKYFYHQQANNGTIPYSATDDFSMGVYPLAGWTEGSFSGDLTYSYTGAGYWTRNGLLKILSSLQIHQQDIGTVSHWFNMYSSNTATVRCLKD